MGFSAEELVEVCSPGRARWPANLPSTSSHAGRRSRSHHKAYGPGPSTFTSIYADDWGRPSAGPRASSSARTRPKELNMTELEHFDSAAQGRPDHYS